MYISSTEERCKARPKYNKDKCKTCKYKTTVMSVGWLVRDKNNKPINVACDFYGITGKRCHYKDKMGEYDLRGEDYDNCALYERGDKT